MTGTCFFAEEDDDAEWGLLVSVMISKQILCGEKKADMSVLDRRSGKGGGWLEGEKKRERDSWSASGN